MDLKYKAIGALLTYSLACGSASAAIYTHKIDNPGGSDSAGDITNFTVQYNTSSEMLRGTFTLNRNQSNNALANSSWMVLSNGLNPKGNEEDLAILFMDYDSGTTWAYQYNGENNSTSYQDSDPIGVYENSLSVSGSGNTATRTVTFDLDASAIQSAGGANEEWSGVSFDDTIGVWYHPAVGQFETTPDGAISSYNVRVAGWYDTGSAGTTYEVPEISSSSAIHSLMLLLGLGALVRERRQKRRSKSALPAV